MQYVKFKLDLSLGQFFFLKPKIHLIGKIRGREETFKESRPRSFPQYKMIDFGGAMTNREHFESNVHWYSTSEYFEEN